MTKTNLNYYEKLSLYSRINTSIININAIFSDETENFRTPMEPAIGEPVRVRIRTAKNNLDEVYVRLKQKDFLMNKAQSDAMFDYYECELPGAETVFDYYFKLVKNGEAYYYNKKGATKELDLSYDFKVYPGFNVPDWAKGAVMYQIYVDRFYNGDETNDVKVGEYEYLGRPVKQKTWDEPVDNDDIWSFYGGDLVGIIKKLKYLQELGVEAIYLNPVFVSPSNHKYDTQDYDYIDPHFGKIIEDDDNPETKYMTRTTSFKNLEASNQVMIDLIKAAHEHGIKVILDGVFNHCGAYNKWLDREKIYDKNKDYPAGAYCDENSPYHDYFHWHGGQWPNNESYDGWWGHSNHPKLNFENSKELYDYIINIGCKWVSPPYNADGWRLDVAADLGFSQEFNHKFWKDFRTAVKEANPEAVILAEHYGDASSWLKGDQWDTLMNYDAFMEPITWFLTGMQKHSNEFRRDMLCNGAAFEGAMRHHMSKLSVQSLLSSMNQLSNHDHSRFLTRTNMTPGRLVTEGCVAAAVGTNRGIFREAIAFQMTWIGAPTIYYGDEAGLAGWTDPDNRRPYPWEREDKQTLEFHREMIKIRKKNPALRTGSLEFLTVDYGVLVYGRFEGNNRLVVALNNDSSEKVLNIPVWRLGIDADATLERLIFSDAHNFTTTPKMFKIKEGMLKVTMPPFGVAVFEDVEKR